MAVETADDLAVFFNEDEFGLAASYTPAGGGGQAVTVVLDQPKEVADLGAGFGGLGVRGPRRIAYLRKSEVAAPAKGDGVTVIGESLTIRSAPRLDESGTVWILDLAEVS